MTKFFKKKTISLIAKILAVITLVSVASAIIFTKSQDAKAIGPTKFVIGKITDKGEFLKSDDYICTNELIGVDDLTIKPDYDSKSSFQVFFYDFEYRYVCSTEVLTEKYEFLNSVPFVEYARIMIIPDRAGLDADDFKVTVFNKADYVKEFDITVSKKQVIGSYKDYFEEDLSLRNKRIKPNWSDKTFSYVDEEGIGVSKIVDLTGVNIVYFTTNKVLTSTDCPFLAFGLKGELLAGSYYQNVYCKISDVYVYRLDCSKFNSILFHYYLDSDCHLFLDKN